MSDYTLCYYRYRNYCSLVCPKYTTDCFYYFAKFSALKELEIVEHSYE